MPLIENHGRLPGPSQDMGAQSAKLANVAGPFGAQFHAGRYSRTEREQIVYEMADGAD
jgi:hypothetical protein